jgi:hypothetical protein
VDLKFLRFWPRVRVAASNPKPHLGIGTLAKFGENV